MNVRFEDFIRQYCRRNSLSIKEFANKVGVSRSTLYNLFEDGSRPSTQQILKIAHAMGVHHTVLTRLKWRDFDVSNQATVQDEQTDWQDSSGFIDETIPDGSIFNAGTPFTKTWTIQNTGQTVWENRCLMCMDDMPVVQNNYPKNQSIKDHMLIPHSALIPIATTRPGEMVTLSVDYTAPRLAGRYISYWKMVDEHKNICFAHGIGLSVSVLVIASGVSF